MAVQSSKDALDNWSIYDWNSALHRHFFTSLPNTSTPNHVIRLYVTSDELCAAVDVHSDHVRGAFINAIKRAIGSRSLGSDASRRYRLWDEQNPQPPPFLAHLILTCMVANDIVGDLKAIGDFRARLSVLLGKSSHGLSRLRQLWQEFEKWSTRRNIEDPTCKRLVLPKIPSSGFHSIIGYSVRLAVPSRRDLTALGTVLRKHKLIGQEPEINAVLRVIGQNIGKFTAQFQEAFRDFTSTYRGAPTSVAFHTIFWSAIREVALSPSVEQHTEGHSKIRLELEDDDGQFWLSITSDKEIDTAETKSIALATTRRSPFRFVLTAEPERVSLAGILFSSRESTKGVETTITTLRQTISSGFLLFKESEDDVYILCVDFPGKGHIRVLISERLLEPFRSACERSVDRLEVSNSIYSGWFELRGLTVEDLRRLDLSHCPSLLGIRCLKPTLPPPEIVIHGGIRVGESFVSLPQAMPFVEIPDAENVSIELRQNHWSSLERRSPFGWSFPPSIDPNVLLGNHMIVAYVKTLPIAEKRINFVEGVFTHEYKTPLDSSRWFVESSHCDVVSLADTTIAITTLQEPSMARFRSFPHHAAPAIVIKSEKALSEPLAIILSCELAERRGIPESYLVSLLTRNFGMRLPNIWPVLRAFVEAGILEAIGDSRWRGRMYFARSPRLVAFRHGTFYEAVLTGLVPPFLLDRFIRLSSTADVMNVQSTSYCEAVPDLPRCRSKNIDVLASFAKELNVGPLEFLQMPNMRMTSIRSVMKPRIDPKNWPIYRKWDWSRRIFLDHPIHATLKAISVEWCRRDDGPDCYKIYRDGLLLWWTRSRTWAILAAFTLAEVPVFEQHANGVLESWGDSLHLPLPIARTVTILSAQAPGPVPSINGCQKYRYNFGDDRFRDSTLEKLWPENYRSKALSAGYLAEITKSGTGPLVPIPLLLRRALHVAVGDSTIHRWGLVPASALPRLYALVNSAAKRGT